MENLSEVDRMVGSVYLLRDLIHERFGLSLNDERGVALITNRLTDRMKQCNCKSFLEYYNLLLSGNAAADEEWRYVMTALAKPMSSFRRHTDAIRVLVDVALPQLLSLSPATPLRIWSAGCSTGEEPLSIAIALNETGWFGRVPIEIYGSDSNYAAIESAMRGLYSEERIHYMDTKLRDRYFTREEDGWQVVPEIHKRVQWKIANLMNQDEIAGLAQSHIIFCNNVFIYFTGHTICKTLRLFARYMPVGAYLFSDKGDYFTELIASSYLFEPSEFNESGVWVRREDKTLSISNDN